LIFLGEIFMEWKPRFVIFREIAFKAKRDTRPLMACKEVKEFSLKTRW
jgi:hypothetical protein